MIGAETGSSTTPPLVSNRRTRTTRQYGGVRGSPAEMTTTALVLQLVPLLLLTMALTGTEGLMCGSPGRAENGTVSLYSANVYNPGQRAEYSCLPGFTLLGNSTRVCQNDGLWSGTWPRCVHNLAHHKPVAASRVVNHYRPDLITDGNPQTCIYLDMRVEDRFIQIDLGKNYLIDGLVIHVPDGYVQELTVFIAEKLTSSPGIQYRRCVQGVSRISGSKLRIECQSEEDAAPVPGRFLHIRDERKIHDFYFALCEIEIYQEEPLSCGIPDQPAFAFTTPHSNSSAGQQLTIPWSSSSSLPLAPKPPTSAATFELHCLPGFRLRGPKWLRCLAGLWDIGGSPTPSHCIAVECDPLEGLRNGHIDFLPAGTSTSETTNHFHHLQQHHQQLPVPRNHYSFGSVARHRCSQGFALFGGDETRTCREDGRWSGTTPFCRPIDCRSPRPILNAEFHLVGGDNHTRPGATAQYTCADGYVPQRINDDQPMETVAVCQADGQWNEPNFYCAEQNKKPAAGLDSSETPHADPRDGISSGANNSSREQSRHARPASPLLETEYGSPPSPPEAEEGEEDEDSDDGSGTAVAATGFVAAFILVLMITVGVALNICRMRTHFERIKKRLTTTVSNHLLQAAALARKDPGMANSKEAEFNSEPSLIHQVKIEGEPVYNEPASPAGAPVALPEDSLSSPGRTGSVLSSEEENTYLDIDLNATMTEELVVEESNPTIICPPPPPPPQTPEEIRRLYARIDKSKKTKNRLQSRGDLHPKKIEADEDLTAVQIVQVSFCEPDSLDSTKSSGSQRPLPPIPQPEGISPEAPEDQHIYATLPLDNSNNISQK